MMNHDTLPHDPLLPQLPQALDAQCMAAVFDALLAPRSRQRVERCEVERIKYRPRRNVAVAYRLMLRDGAGGASTEQRVAARFCSGGDSLGRARKAIGHDAAASTVGLAVSHAPALDMVAYWWPHDPKLGPAARLLGDAGRLREQALPAVVNALTGGHGRLLAHRLSVAQVVPEHRVTARVDLEVEPWRGAAAVRRVVYVKADAEQRGSTTQAVMAALARSPAAREGSLHTPQPLLWQPAFGLQWQSALPGRMLLDIAPEVGIDASARVGAMLAALHATPVPAARRCSFDALRERIATVADTLALVNPSWAMQLVRLRTGLVAGVDALRGQPNATLHGDLHPRNILVDGDRLGLIDLDNVRQGPAVVELGDWMADALHRALLAGRTAGSALPACRAFIASYSRAARWQPSEPMLAWSVAHSLFSQRIWRCVVNLKPGRYALVPAQLDLCAALLRGGTLDAAAGRLQEAA
jgi:aminoglycoside phosphotransferase (APT) family kinase protein